MEQRQSALQIIVTKYGDPEVIKVIRSFAKRGRLTMIGDEKMLRLPLNTITTKQRGPFAIHNKIRLGIEDVKVQFHFDDEQAGAYVASLRRDIINTCNQYLQLRGA